MKKIMAVLLLCLSTQAVAVMVGGVKLEDKVTVDKRELVLNGAGTRTKVIFNIYVAALYLGAKKTSAESVLADVGTKRMKLYILHHVSAGDFMDAFNKAINANNTPEEYAPIAARLLKFSRVFREVGELEKGSVILIDYLPSVGMVLTINGKERGRIEGEDFYRAMMKIWLGKNPVQDSVKRGLLGG